MFKISLNPLKPTRRLRRSKFLLQYTLIVLSVSFSIIACQAPPEVNSSTSVESTTESGVLTIWWNKGYILEEDEALQQVVQDWEAQTGNDVKLSFYTEDELPQKAQRALQGGQPPDILFSTRAEYELTPRLAWEGKLTDVSPVIEPVEDLYSQSVLDAVSLYNNAEQKRSYYAVPIYQATIYINYWRDLVEQSGRSIDEIPQDWESFWEFWKEVQEDLRASQGEIYGLGFTTSAKSSDTYIFFEHVLEAFDVELLDGEGQLQVSNPEVREGIIQSLDWYTQVYKQGYVPPGAVEWLNPDNNFNLLNRTVVMTPNPTLSIPAAQRQDEEIYFEKLGTLEFPNKPSGEPMRYLTSVRQAIVFAASKNQETALEFLTHLVQPEILEDYLKAATGRYFPVTEPAWDDPFWRDPADPHISTATKMLTDRPTRSLPFTRNPAYSQVLEEQVWGEALHSIAVDGTPPEQAADTAIEQIEAIFAQWENVDR